MWIVDLITNGDREFVLRGWVTCQIINGPRLSRTRQANKSFIQTDLFGPRWAFCRKCLFVRGFVKRSYKNNIIGVLYVEVLKRRIQLLTKNVKEFLSSPLLKSRFLTF